MTARGRSLNGTWGSIPDDSRGEGLTNGNVHVIRRAEQLRTEQFGRWTLKDPQAVDLTSLPSNIPVWTFC